MPTRQEWGRTCATLGGDTFDVTLLCIEEGVCEAKATALATARLADIGECDAARDAGQAAGEALCRDLTHGRCTSLHEFAPVPGIGTDVVACDCLPEAITREGQLGPCVAADPACKANPYYPKGRGTHRSSVVFCITVW